MNLLILGHFDFLDLGEYFGILIVLMMVGGYLSARRAGKSKMQAAAETPFADIPLGILDKITDIWDVMDTLIINEPSILQSFTPYEVVSAFMKELDEGVDVVIQMKVAADWDKYQRWQVTHDKAQAPTDPRIGGIAAKVYTELEKSK